MTELNRMWYAIVLEFTEITCITMKIPSLFIFFFIQRIQIINILFMIIAFITYTSNPFIRLNMWDIEQMTFCCEKPFFPAINGTLYFKGISWMIHYHREDKDISESLKAYRKASHSPDHLWRYYEWMKTHTTIINRISQYFCFGVV